MRRSSKSILETDHQKSTFHVQTKENDKEEWKQKWRYTEATVAMERLGQNSSTTTTT
jgi:hypothetical protein